MKYNETQYYYDGYAAHTNGLAYEQCQIEIGTPARLEWCRGWRDAEQDSRKKAPTPDSENTNHQFESLAVSQQPAWNGEGLPPVGSDCEFKPYDNSDWIFGKVNYLSDHTVVLGLGKTNDDGQAEVVKHPRTLKFRPVPTEAERKREEAIEEIASLIGRGTFSEDASGIYYAIAAGKIPGVKLEASDE